VLEKVFLFIPKLFLGILDIVSEMFYVRVQDKDGKYIKQASTTKLVRNVYHGFFVAFLYMIFMAFYAPIENKYARVNPDVLRVYVSLVPVLGAIATMIEILYAKNKSSQVSRMLGMRGMSGYSSYSSSYMQSSGEIGHGVSSGTTDTNAESEDISGFIDRVNEDSSEIIRDSHINRMSAQKAENPKVKKNRSVKVPDGYALVKTKDMMNSDDKKESPKGKFSSFFDWY
jgi:hypothetical protein